MAMTIQNSLAFGDELKREFGFSPNVGYTTSEGLILGAQLALGYSFAEHWQAVARSYFSISTGTGERAAYYQLGVQYSFGETLDRSISVEVGAAYLDPHFLDSRSAEARGYSRVGYRKRLSETSEFYWAPSMTVFVGKSTFGNINPIEFSIFF